MEPVSKWWDRTKSHKSPQNKSFSFGLQTISTAKAESRNSFSLHNLNPKGPEKKKKCLGNRANQITRDNAISKFVTCHQEIIHRYNLKLWILSTVVHSGCWKNAIGKILHNKSATLNIETLKRWSFVYSCMGMKRSLLMHPASRNYWSAILLNFDI